jgi:hypothetical protein
MAHARSRAPAQPSFLDMRSCSLPGAGGAFESHRIPGRIPGIPRLRLNPFSTRAGASAGVVPGRRQRVRGGGTRAAGQLGRFSACAERRCSESVRWWQEDECRAVASGVAGRELGAGPLGLWLHDFRAWRGGAGRGGQAARRSGNWDKSSAGVGEAVRVPEARDGGVAAGSRRGGGKRVRERALGRWSGSRQVLPGVQGRGGG